MLEVKDLHAYYGKSHILQGVNMYIDAGEVVSLLGRNGVGRSTTVKAIMGEVPPQGSIKFKGGDIAGLPSYRIAHLGLGYVPEHRDIFPDGASKPDAWHQGYQVFGQVAARGYAQDVSQPRSEGGHASRRAVGRREADANCVPYAHG